LMYGIDSISLLIFYQPIPSVVPILIICKVREADLNPQNPDNGAKGIAMQLVVAKVM